MKGNQQPGKRCRKTGHGNVWSVRGQTEHGGPQGEDRQACQPNGEPLPAVTAVQKQRRKAEGDQHRHQPENGGGKFLGKVFTHDIPQPGLHQAIELGDPAGHGGSKQQKHDGGAMQERGGHNGSKGSGRAVRCVAHVGQPSPCPATINLEPSPKTP